MFPLFWNYALICGVGIFAGLCAILNDKMTERRTDKENVRRAIEWMKKR